MTGLVASVIFDSSRVVNDEGFSTLLPPSGLTTSSHSAGGGFSRNVSWLYVIGESRRCSPPVSPWECYEENCDRLGVVFGGGLKGTWPQVLRHAQELPGAVGFCHVLGVIMSWSGQTIQCSVTLQTSPESDNVEQQTPVVITCGARSRYVKQ